MSIIIDLIILAIAVVIVLVSRKRGFFKTVVSVASVVAAFIIAFAFAPKLAGYLYDNVVLDKLSDSISTTVSSITNTGTEAENEDPSYDVSKLEGNDEFNDIVNRFGGDTDKINEYIDGVKENTSVGVEKVCRNVASPLAESVSSLIAFILVFILAYIILKVAVSLIGKLFKLPVLRDIDKLLGTVFGIVCALLFILAVSAFAPGIGTVLNAIAPNMFDKAVLENSLIIRLFSNFNLQNLIINKSNFNK